MKPFWLIPVLLIAVIALMSPVSAVTVTAEDVSSYSVVADEGMVIYQIIVNDLPIGTNQTHTLNYNGQTFLLTIGTYTEYGIWKNADISLTLPNGSVQTAHTSASTIVGNYKTTIQPVFAQAQSGTIAFLTIDLMIGISPAGAQFSTQPMGWNPSSAIPFSAASGNLGASSDVYVIEMTKADFQNNVVAYNPVYGLTNLGADVFQWTWAGILGFISMIPVIGPIAVGLLEVMGGVLGTGYFWLVFVVSNFPAILGGVECLILMMAVINAGSGKNSFSRLGKNIVSYNARFLYAVVTLVELVFNWTVRIVEMVASVVNALKPI
jgi:hypothetical protein